MLASMPFPEPFFRWRPHPWHELSAGEHAPDRVDALIEVTPFDLHGLLTRRNECAHPSTYLPGLNETLGYIAETLNRIEYLQPRSL